MTAKKASKSKARNFFIIAMLIFNIIFAIALILSYFAAYVSPEKFWMIAFFGIAFPYIFLSNFIFLAFWLIFKRKYALILGLLLLAGVFNVFKIIQSSKKYDVKELSNAIKVISFNVRNFDIYNQDKHWNYNFTFRNRIFAFLKKEQPDILCFQEYVHDATGKFNTTDSLKKFLHAKNANLVYTANSRNMNYFGYATYTRYPIIDTGRIEFKTVSGNICIYTDVKINSDTVRVYNLHLESIRMKSEDYWFADRVVQGYTQHLDVEKNSERIISRLKNAFAIRAPQAQLVADHIKKCPYPVILCGDFNDTPTSYAYHTVSSGLKDAFVESGNGIGQTYAGVFPLLRIDYIMHSKEFKAYNFETGTEVMSDHYSVMCYLKFDK